MKGIHRHTYETKAGRKHRGTSFLLPLDFNDTFFLLPLDWKKQCCSEESMYFPPCCLFWWAYTNVWGGWRVDTCLKVWDSAGGERWPSKKPRQPLFIHKIDTCFWLQKGNFFGMFRSFCQKNPHCFYVQNSCTHQPLRKHFFGLQLGMKLGTTNLSWNAAGLFIYTECAGTERNGFFQASRKIFIRLP